MSINTLIVDDLQLIYDELYDAKATFKGNEISVFFANDYEVQSSKEKVLRVQSKDVVGISNSDVITLDGADYKVITFIPDANGLETTVGLEK